MFSTRMRPNFIIIGGVKCASTSLFRYLIEHPNILPGHFKEPAFFNGKNRIQATLKIRRYLRNFPKNRSTGNTYLNWPILSSEGKIIETTFEKVRYRNQHYITGEASATYNTTAKPEVIKFLLPKVKIIFILRDPTMRFISHWKMFQRFTEEGRKGYDIGELVPFIKKEITAHQKSKRTRLLHQGLYGEIIQKWQTQFDDNHFLLVESQHLNENLKAQEVMNEVTGFLNIPNFDYSKILAEKFNVAPSELQNEEAVYLLNTFYGEGNQALKTQHGVDFTH